MDERSKNKPMDTVRSRNPSQTKLTAQSVAHISLSEASLVSQRLAW